MSYCNSMTPMQQHEKYLNEAFDLAYQSLRTNIGGPFGAVVVRDGKILGKGGNRVIIQNDPTAHAEIVAIREACTNIGHFDLSGAVLYATCEPCPMCLSAIYWANIREVFFCSTRYQAESAGFRDNHIYEEINHLPEEREMTFHQVPLPEADGLFREWVEKQDKMVY